MDNKIMYKKILTSIAFIATIGLSQSATVSTLSMGTGMYEAVGIAKRWFCDNPKELYNLSN